MSQVTEGTTDPLVRRVRFLLTAWDLYDAELAQALDLSQSGLSKAFRRPGKLALHQTKIAEFFGLKEKVLIDFDIADDAVLKHVHRKKAAVETEVPVHAGTLVRLAKDVVGHFGRGKWALLDGKQRAPQRAELVAYGTENGYLVRRFVPGEGGSAFLVHPHDEMSIKTISASEVKNLRVVLMIGDFISESRDSRE